MPRLHSLFLPTALCCTFLAAARAQQPASPQLRPPATPLITHDPYFSVWSNTDKLTDSPTKHWTGHPEPLNSLIRVDGKAFRLMGRDPRDVSAATQTAMTLTPTHTRYSFTAGAVQVDLTFFTPAFLDDLDILSRPVTYVTWTAHATDGGQHAVAVYLDANAELATSFENQPVNFMRHRTASTEVLSVGTRSQDVLNRSGDDLRIDWGYFHLVVPNDEAAGEGAQTSISVDPAKDFVANGSLSRVDDTDPEQTEYHSAPTMATVLSLGQVSTAPVSRHVLVAYTDEYGIQYLHRDLRSWWQRDNKPAGTMLDEAAAQYTQLDAKGTQFDTQLTQDMTHVGGEHYAWICTLAYRQAVAAHKLVADVDGKPFYMSKENFSNGSIDTVDLIYPSAPIFLFFNPRLLEAEILPLLEYVNLPNHWHFPFAPHDLGQYPLANGQTYGGGEKTEENQMPVEESGNLLIAIDALAQVGGQAHGLDLARQYWPTLTQWANYLKVHGLDPEKQLTTDDFAGHVTHNANLSLKAIDALAAYADLAKRLDHPAEAKAYAATAREYAGKWVTMDKEGDHYKLAYDSPGTWSQKYNLIWDKILDYNLFPKSVRDSEIAFYKTKLNVYGLPLDSRKDYTKLDWELWTATLADKQEDFLTLIDPIYKWTNETTSRVPMTDWYDTKTGKQEAFQARSVVGGVFIKALTDKRLADEYRTKAKAIDR